LFANPLEKQSHLVFGSTENNRSRKIVLLSYQVLDHLFVIQKIGFPCLHVKKYFRARSMST
jgi:hypothetical protein